MLVPAATASVLTYTVLRNGAPVGRHVIDISGPTNRQNVKITTDIKVKIIFLTVYHFTHNAEEHWRGGRLISLSSNADDNGTDKSLRARADARNIEERATIKGETTTRTVPLKTLPASLWHEDIVRQTHLINTLDGHLMRIHADDLGTDRVRARGRSIDAHHYRIKGDLARELWYDTKQILVRVRFKAPDGSTIVYALN